MVIDYEDGKHLIDRGVMKMLSSLAELLIKPMVKGAILATPTLADRLPSSVPNVIVPGILSDHIPSRQPPPPGESIHLLYSGSLDVERGIPLLLEFLDSGLIPSGIRLEITGQGKFAPELESIAKRNPDQIRFHGKVPEPRLLEIQNRCQFGLNLQSSSNPISKVTFPSKTFDYLNAGLRLITTKSAGVETVIGHAAVYLEEESVIGLAAAIEQAVAELHSNNGMNVEMLRKDYSLAGTSRRLTNLFARTTKLPASTIP